MGKGRLSTEVLLALAAAIGGGIQWAVSRMFSSAWWDSHADVILTVCIGAAILIVLIHRWPPEWEFWKKSYPLSPPRPHPYPEDQDWDGETACARARERLKLKPQQCGITYEPYPNWVHRREDAQPPTSVTTLRPRFEINGWAERALPYLYCIKKWDGSKWVVGPSAEMRVPLSWPVTRTVPRETQASFRDYDFILLMECHHRAARDVLSLYTTSFFTGIRDIKDDIPPGKYRLTVGVEGANFETVKRDFELEWNGDYASLRLTLV